MIKFTSFEKPLPYIYIENLYTDFELEKIWCELDYYQSNGDVFLSNNINAAESPDGQVLTKKKSVFLDEMFYQRRMSSILTLNRKVFDNNIICYNSNNWYFKKFWPDCDSTLVSYYENQDVYYPHADNTVVTMITWLYKEPKKFVGGRFMFPDHDLSFECKNNHAIAFPGAATHAVDSVIMDNEDCGKGLGRYSISQFLSYKI